MLGVKPMPFKTEQGIEESIRRRRASEERLFSTLVPVMNNTKWREVFTIIVDRSIWFQVQLVDWKDGETV